MKTKIQRRPEIMRYKQLLAALALSMTMLAGSAAFAADKPCPEGMECKQPAGMDEKLDKMAKELGLTDKQKEQIKAHREKCSTEMTENRKLLMEKRRALKDELDKTGTDNAKIDALKKDIKDLQAKDVDSMVDRVSEMKQILTPEQFQKMNKQMEERMKKMKGKEGKGMHKKEGKHKMGEGGDDMGPGMHGDMESPGPGMK
jgi:periplasmic protein CpxP/Spy